MALPKGSLERPFRVAGEKQDFLSPNSLVENPVASFKIDDQLFHVIPQTVQRDNMKHPGKFSEMSREIEVAGELKIENRNYLIVRIDHHIQLEKNNQVGILTKREIQIVMLVADGKVNKEIADRLNISEYTVSTHLRRIFAKLRVDSRAAMIYRWTQLF